MLEESSLAFIGSKNPVDYSLIIDTEASNIWSFSLTNILLAMAEAVETLGYIIPPYDYYDDENYRTTEDQIRKDKEMKIYEAICQKYGFSGSIIPTY